MRLPLLPFVKVCGQTHQSSIDAALGMGANAIGFIFHPSSPRHVTPDRASSLKTGLAKRTGVFVKQDGSDILDIMQSGRLDLAQLHGTHSLEDAAQIGVRRVIRVVWPERYNSTDELQSYLDKWKDHCAYYLLDAGLQGGGHGKSLSNIGIIQSLHFPRPWLLAGGLNAENICSLQRELKPDGFDLNSGLEIAAGLKCSKKTLATFSQISCI